MKSASKGKGSVRLAYLGLKDAPAQSVCLAGTFNNWRPEATRMRQIDRDCWIADLSLVPGRYEYRLVVDGEWLPDLLAEEYAFNPFGGINSVLTISARCESSRGRRVNQVQPHRL
jgi:Glycogen recognition site of AMP-activated protein kinase